MTGRLLWRMGMLFYLFAVDSIVLVGCWYVLLVLDVEFVNGGRVWGCKGVCACGWSMYRAFINQIFNFVGVGLGLYIIANVYTWVSNDAIIKESVKCKFCRKRISPKVSLSFSFGWCAQVCGYGIADLYGNGIGAEVCQLYELAGWERGAVLMRNYGGWCRTVGWILLGISVSCCCCH